MSHFCISSSLLLILILAGCQSSGKQLDDWSSMEYSNPENFITISHGDVLDIKFAGTTLLDSTPTVRRDGKISLTLKDEGDLEVEGKTLAQVEKELLEIYADDIRIQEVDVSLASSGAHVYISGAVVQAGRVALDRPLTVLEAIMEAGGYSPTESQLKRVKVLRYNGGRQQVFEINLEDLIDGKVTRPFYLKPFDIIIVPEKRRSLFR